tara:strand:+ start:15620 stop:16780 length:1161 start_codon:yes stop_codon:yes gene_type:complete
MATKSMRRRDFLALTGASIALAKLGGCASDEARFPEGTLWSAANRIDGSHHLQAAHLGGTLAVAATLPVRAHASVMRPGGRQMLAVSRRPGTEFFVTDVATGEILQTISTPAGRHFLGHGVFDSQGRYFYATENVFDDAVLPDLTPQDSVIGVYDAESDYERVRELPTYGVGAHELLFSSDGRTLIIANGGIYTHPSQPREKLNVGTMQPSLVYVDSRDGALIESHGIDEAQLSIRHLTLAPDDTVVFGCQHAGVSQGPEALVFAHKLGGQVRALQALDTTWDSFDSYIASVCVHPESGVVAATSPIGGLVGFWNLTDGTFLGSSEAIDCAGIAVAQDCLVVTTGIGETLAFDAYDQSSRGKRSTDDTRWDNHCIVVPGALKSEYE